MAYARRFLYHAFVQIVYLINVLIVPLNCTRICQEQLPAHFVSTAIYSGIAWFPCDSTAFLFDMSVQLSVGQHVRGVF